MASFGRSADVTLYLGQIDHARVILVSITETDVVDMFPHGLCRQIDS